jgi:predicted RNA-binding protein with PIN domain
MLQLHTMPYLIDGHNLIPKLGLRLDAVDDEMALVARLQDFCRRRRAQVDVYFDGAPPGQPSTRRFGAVSAHFVRLGSSADAAIERRLARLGKAARNWIVVSSDQRVQVAARAAGAQVASSEAFASQVADAGVTPAEPPETERRLSPEEVETWLMLFEGRKKG